MPSVFRLSILVSWLFFWFLLGPSAGRSQEAGFQVIPLGVAGGLEEDNLSAYLVGPLDGLSLVALDAGTLRIGVRRALAAGAISSPKGFPEQGLELEQAVMSRQIAAYLISHAHLDHVAGLVINATDDRPKPILASDGVLADLQAHLFNWRIWPNFGDHGTQPALSQYHYQILPTAVATPVADTGLTVEVWPLSHSHGYASSAFLLASQGQYLLYCGDTGPDVVEGEGRLAVLWQRVAPLIRENRLRGIFIESAYPSDRPDNQLYGHLTPRHLLAELGVLGKMAPIQGLTVIITHVKPTSVGLSVMQERILRELNEGNTLGVSFRIAHQGERMVLN